MKIEFLVMSAAFASFLGACGDDTGSGAAGGSTAGGAGQGGQAAGGQAQGGDAQGGSDTGGGDAGGGVSGGNGAGGAAGCVPSGSGSAADLDCAAYCEAVVATDCANGPPTVEACSPICEQLKTSCPGYDNLVDCAGKDPEFACDANGMVATVGCEDVFASCVVPCLGG